MDINAYNRLVDSGLRPSTQRLAIMSYLLGHRTHPTVEDVFQGVVTEVPTLSRTTVYNTLRLFSEHKAAQMITIDDHHVCYDGDIHPHVHFLCRECGRVFDLMDEKAPKFLLTRHSSITRASAKSAWRKRRKTTRTRLRNIDTAQGRPLWPSAAERVNSLPQQLRTGTRAAPAFFN